MDGLQLGLGGYKWSAILEDGTIVHQYDQSHKEVSVDILRDMGSGVKTFMLVPQIPGYPPIQFDVSGGDWIKAWTRTTKVTEVGEVVHASEGPVVDKLGIKPNGSQHWVYVHIHKGGLIHITASEEST